MALEIFRYTLRSRSRLNAASSRVGHNGVLIRVNGGGHGCIHPWPELGDDPLPVQLEKLKSGDSTPLIEQALECAAIDEAARKQLCNLIAEYPPPLSHWTASTEAGVDDPTAIRAQGFDTVKLKGHGKELEILKGEVRCWQEAGFRIRIDFNETGDVGGIAKLWAELDDRSVIDFLEDPIPWDIDTWRELKSGGIPLAADRGLDISGKAELADVLIVKPALHSPEHYQPAAGQYLIVTSYMDHPVGQMFAAYTAGALKLSGRCGLLTHHLFEPNSFNEQITTAGPTLNPPPGYGLGFDDLLAGLPWEKC